MEFYLRSYQDGSELHFPVPPREHAPTSRSAKKVSFTPLEDGARSFPRGMNEKTTQLGGIFPAVPRAYVKDWRPPAEIVELIERWLRENHRLAYLVTDAPKTSSYDVFVESFTDDPGAGSRDVEYTLSLCQWGHLTVPTDAEPDVAVEPGLQIAGAPSPADPEPLVEQPADPPPDNYVIRAGDSLWEIARLLYGDGSLWPSLYDANAPGSAHPVLGPNPNLIQPNVTLVVPELGG